MKRLFILMWCILILALSIGCCVHGTLDTQKKIENNRLKEFVTHLNESSVAIANEDGNLVCTGVWVNTHNFITARHCVENYDSSVTLGTKIRFITHRKSNNIEYLPKVGIDDMYYGYIKAYHPEKDIAAIIVYNDYKHDIAKIYTDDIFNGMPIHILGHPGPANWTYMTGVVSRTRVMGTFGMIQKTLHITALSYGGTSGGGAYANDGGLVGMSIFSYRRIPGMKFFLHRDEIVKFLNVNKIKYN